MRVDERHREPRVNAGVGHHGKYVPGRDRFAGAVPRGGESGRRLERGAGIAVVRVGPCPVGADPLERELEALASRGADVLEVAAGYRRCDEEDVVPHSGAVCVGARVEAAVRRVVVPAQFVRGCHDRLKSGVGAEREREWARGLGIRAAELHDRGSAEPPARRGEHVMAAAARPGEAGAGREAPEDVQATLRCIDQVFERNPDPVVPGGQGRREPRHHLQVRAGEGARVHLVGAHRLGEGVGSRAAGNGEDAHGDVLVVGVGAREPAQLAPAEPHLARELHGAPAGAGRVALPRVLAHEVHVELLALERATEGVDRELRRADQALRVEGHEVRAGSEIVAPAEIRVGARHGEALRQAPRLIDPIVRARIAESGVPGAVQEPDLGEQGADAAACILAPAGLVLVAGAHVVVPDAVPGAGVRLELVAAPAAGRGLQLAARRHAAAPGHEIDRGAERIAAQQHRRAVHHVHALHVLERQQIEVDLMGVRLVGAHAIHVDGHALRQPDHRGHLESAQRHVELRRRAELVRGRHTRELLEGIRERAYPAGVEGLDVERGGASREAARQLAHRRQPHAGHDHGSEGGCVLESGIGLLRASRQRKQDQRHSASKQVRSAECGMRIGCASFDSALRTPHPALS